MVSWYEPKLISNVFYLFFSFPNIQTNKVLENSIYTRTPLSPLIPHYFSFSYFKAQFQDQSSASLITKIKFFPFKPLIITTWIQSFSLLFTINNINVIKLLSGDWNLNIYIYICEATACRDIHNTCQTT